MNNRVSMILHACVRACMRVCGCAQAHLRNYLKNTPNQVLYVYIGSLNCYYFCCVAL